MTPAVQSLHCFVSRLWTSGFQRQQTHDIIGAGMEVHRVLGCRFQERVYRVPFSIELAARNVPHRHEVKLPIVDKGHQLPVAYRIDFVCFRSILVELKALPMTGPLEQSQMINYLKAAKVERPGAELWRPEFPIPPCGVGVCR